MKATHAITTKLAGHKNTRNTGKLETSGECPEAA
jgi:hypothetical protein